MTKSRYFKNFLKLLIKDKFKTYFFKCFKSIEKNILKFTFSIHLTIVFLLMFSTSSSTITTWSMLVDDHIIYFLTTKISIFLAQLFQFFRAIFIRIMINMKLFFTRLVEDFEITEIIAEKWFESIAMTFHNNNLSHI